MTGFAVALQPASMEKIILDIKVQGLHDDYLSHASYYVLVGKQRLSYLVSDPSNKILALKVAENAGQPNGLAALASQDALLQTQPAQTAIGIQNEYATLVPNRMFDPTNLPSYFKLLAHFGPTSKMSFGFDDLPRFDAKMVYAIEPEIEALLKEKWPETRTFHAKTALLEAYRSYCNASTYNVFVNVTQHIMHVVVFDGTEILFSNSFVFKSASDFVYFLLLPLKQLQIEPSSTSVVVCGEITEDSDCLTLARRFTAPFRFMQLPRVFDYPGAVQSLPSHFCFDLYSLKLKP